MLASLGRISDAKNPNPIGTITPKIVITIAERPVALICFISVSRPAENIINITPISAINATPSKAVGLNIA